MPIKYHNQQQANIKLHYPFNDKFDYTTQLVRINLDKAREEDIKSGKGFVITPPVSIKKDFKLQTGIFDARYGGSLQDIDSYNGRYRCNCGALRGAINHGERCDNCGSIVTFKDDDVSIFGYMILKEKYAIIHPNIYSTLEGFIGAARLNRIIEPDVKVDKNGKVLKPDPPVKKDEPFRHIGLMEFRERFDEIMKFYVELYPNKVSYYENIMNDRDLVFTTSIPVFSSLLRPSKLDGALHYEKTNENYNLLNNLVKRCNRDTLRINQKIKEKLNLMYDIQTQINVIYLELKECLARKKGKYCPLIIANIVREILLNCWKSVKL